LYVLDTGIQPDYPGNAGRVGEGVRVAKNADPAAPSANYDVVSGLRCP
jgi:hypothetical protein